MAPRVFSYLSSLQIKREICDMGNSFPTSGRPSSLPQIFLVVVPLSDLVHSLAKETEKDALAFLQSLVDRAFVFGAKESRLSEVSKLEPEVNGDLFFVFFEESKANEMLLWLQQKENKARLGGEPRLVIQDFENDLQYETEVKRLTTPKA